jgi:hypothetical protein
MPLERSPADLVLPEERARLGAVLDRFMAGQISVERFGWQVGRFLKSQDGGVAGIAGAFFDLGDLDWRSWWRGWASLGAVQQASVERSRRFLHTALPYEWPEPPSLLLVEIGKAVLGVAAMTGIGYIVIAAVLLGIGFWLNAIVVIVPCGGVIAGAWIGWRALKRVGREAVEHYETAGDAAVWPFLRRSDYEHAKAVAMPGR